MNKIRENNTVEIEEEEEEEEDRNRGRRINMVGSSNLPDPAALHWAHSVCTKAQLEAALLDTTITAIETDIIMGHKVVPSAAVVALADEIVEIEQQKKTQDYQNNTRPIMGHPPMTTSDLTFDDFIEHCITDDNQTKLIKILKLNFQDFESTETKLQHKHLKLDFKDLDTIEPVLATLLIVLRKIECNTTTSSSSTDHNNNTNTNNHKILYLNADILPGPGCRTNQQQRVAIPAEDFLDRCLQFTELLPQIELRQRIVLSLGYKCDPRAFVGYTPADVEAMHDLIQQYDLMNPTRLGGIVLALNARVLVKNPQVFDGLLQAYPTTTFQLLIWTGTGEPQISQSKITKLQHHFKDLGCLHRVGFDCQVRSNTTTPTNCQRMRSILCRTWLVSNFVSFVSCFLCDYRLLRRLRLDS